MTSFIPKHLTLKKNCANSFTCDVLYFSLLNLFHFEPCKHAQRMHKECTNMDSNGFQHIPRLCFETWAERTLSSKSLLRYACKSLESPLQEGMTRPGFGKLWTWLTCRRCGKPVTGLSTWSCSVPIHEVRVPIPDQYMYIIHHNPSYS